MNKRGCQSMPLGLDPAAHWFRQFRLHLPDLQPVSNGKVQMDEAYFHSLALLMAKQVGTKKLAYQIIKKNSVNKTEATQ